MRKRFTLIEMLVVVAIIGILAAMLAPNLQKALRRAKVLQCENNMHQLGLILNLYSSDYNATLPTYNADIFCGYTKKGAWGRDTQFLIGALDFFWKRLTSYDLTHGIASCPFRPLADKWMTGGWNSRSSYFWVLLDGTYNKPKEWRPLRTSAKGGANKVIVSDPATEYFNGNADFASWMNNHLFNGNFTESQATLSLDGHVKLLLFPDTIVRNQCGKSSEAAGSFWP